MAVWTRERIVELAKELAAKSDGPLSSRQFYRRSGVSDYRLYRLFPDGGWTEVRQLAGIGRHPRDKDHLSNEQLLQEFHRVASELGTIPSWRRFFALTSVGQDALPKRFGGRRAALQRYREWLEKNHPTSPLLPIQAGHKLVKPAAAPKGLRRTRQWTKGAGAVLGAPISFRALGCAPTNEQGVVCLFGMVCAELGLIVEAFQSVYPDCEAKRCIDIKHDRWQRVRIEFEYLSSNFLDHGHDPAGCDLIVCWKHDWPECPLEVIELRSVLEQLQG
jgi:hypothetical protein